MRRILFLAAQATGGGRGGGMRRALPAAGAALILAAAAAGLRAAGLDDPDRKPPRGNFIVHGNGPRDRAILDHAEAVRGHAYRLLHGEAAPARWRTPCAVHVHATAASFAAAVGGSPAGARGATSLEFATGGVSMRRIDVMGDGPDVVPDGLAHEIAHVVLADRFIDAPPPRWADEGLALLFDAPEKQRRHDADFRDALRAGRAWSAADLLAMEDYPATTQRQRVFYGQSAALVRWLVARRDVPTFVAFAADCSAIGTEAALAKHYGVGSVTGLDAAWSEAESVAPSNTEVPNLSSAATP